MYTIRLEEAGARRPWPEWADDYPYWMHCTGGIHPATFRVGDTLVHDRGRLTALENPDVIAVAEKHSGRPGLDPGPWRY